MKTTLRRAILEQDSSPTMIKMSLGVTETRLTCATYKQGLGFKGRIGACVDAHGKIYFIFSEGAGVTSGLQGTLFFGTVKSSKKDIRGTYTTYEVGGTLGGSVEFLSSESNDGNSITLYGLSVGSMYFSINAFILE